MAGEDAGLTGGALLAVIIGCSVVGGVLLIGLLAVLFKRKNKYKQTLMREKSLKLEQQKQDAILKDSIIKDIKRENANANIISGMNTVPAFQALNPLQTMQTLPQTQMMPVQQMAQNVALPMQNVVYTQPVQQVMTQPVIYQPVYQSAYQAYQPQQQGYQQYRPVMMQPQQQQQAYVINRMG